jgi:cobalt-precorrin 5A hydrolase
MECGEMKVAGIGFRGEATVTSLRAALAAAGDATGVIALATGEAKAGTAAIVALAAELGLPIIGVSQSDIAAQATLTHSARVHQKTGTGSLAEAAALAAVGSNALLLGPRAVSPDRMATAAIAIRKVP